MHRSGTSALTRMLGSLGCDLPGTLMPPNEHNERGYWESEPISALNDALLESAGSAWDDWEPFNPGWYASPVAAGFRDQACALLEQEFQDSRMFVLKDPRVARLLPFWIDVLAEFGADTRVAMPIRNPLEVAGSLHERDTIETSVGLLLWLRHVLEAEAASRDLRRCFVRFEDLLRDWEGVAAALARDLRVSWPRQSTSARIDFEKRLESSSRHQVFDDAAVRDSPEVSRWVASTFAVVDRWARGEVRDSDKAALDGVREAFDEAGRAFARSIVTGMRAGQRNRRLEQEVRALQDVVADREGQIDSLNRAVADRDDNVGYLEGVVRSKDRELNRQGETISDRDRELDALRHEVAARDGEITALIEERDRRVADLDRQIEVLRDAVGDRDEAIATRDRLIEDREGRIAALTADRDRQTEVLQGVSGERDALRQTAEDRQSQIEALHAVIDVRERELAGVYGSDSWRLTKPLRAVKQLLFGARREMLRALAGAARVGGRLLPLPRSARERLRRAAIASFPSLGPISRSAPASSSPKTFVPSGWIDLADRSYEAHRNGTGVPILFDPDWYLASYPDVRVAGIDGLAHYMEHGAVEGRWPVDLQPEEVDPTVEALHRLDCTTDAAHSFDPGFCRILYPELAALSDAELALVCVDNGERVGSKAAFVQEICDTPREIPLDFNASEYIRLYPDLRYLADQSPLEALRHYMRHGRFEPRLHTLRTDRVADAPEDERPPAPTLTQGPPLCVLVHVYYPELWEELSGYIANLPPDGYDLYVNLVDDTLETGLLARIRETFPDAHVYVSENVGRDIGGYFNLLRNLRMEDYRLFCLLHTKKSPHMGEGEVQRWRRKLLEPLLGTPERAAENVRTMLEDESVGMIGSARCRYTEMNANHEKYRFILEGLGIPESTDGVEFLSGTMMFLRPDVLGRVFEAAQGVEFERSDAVTVEGDPDGAWAHAVERVFGTVVADMGYRLEWR